MYESFYGLKEKPFTLLPDPEYLYLSPKHQRALTLLEYGMMNQAGFSVICGDTGAGKTTLIRRLLTELGDDTTVGLITNTHQSFGELLNWVLMAFGLEGEGKSKAQMHQIFIDFLIEQYAQNKHTVLIVDEAQNMSADTLEELRMLSNINADKDQVLQVILAGQPALRETLRKPELMQFAQRIAVDYYLEALSMEETRAYINHRLQIAGAEKSIFTDEACNAIYKYSRGTPRLINLLCDTSLVYGFAEQTTIINEQLVHDVVSEQHSNSIIPTFNTKQPHATDSMPLQTVDKTQSEVVEQVQSISEKAEPVEEKQYEEVIAELAQRAVQEVKNADQTAAVVENTASSVTKKVMNADAQAGINESKDETVEFVDTVKQESTNVRPIVSRQEEHFAQSEKSANETPSAETEIEKPNNQQDDIQSETPEPETAESINTEKQQAKNNSGNEDAAPYMTQGHHTNEDVYPIVHVEDNSGKGMNMMILGLAGGMFIASIVMLVVVWMLFGSNDNNAVVQQTVQQSSVEQDTKREADRRELEALQKERDAALAVSRALERERDAALQAAKAQEEIRAAELRAAEILAEQERKVEARLREASARAREAERAEAKALERERRLRAQADKRLADQEAQRLEALRKERMRLEALAAEQAKAEQASQLIKEEVVAEESVVNEQAQEADVESEKKKEERFSANPCNSPSAKFLSTCKK